MQSSITYTRELQKQLLADITEDSHRSALEHSLYYVAAEAHQYFV